MTIIDGELVSIPRTVQRLLLQRMFSLLQADFGRAEKTAKLRHDEHVCYLITDFNDLFIHFTFRNSRNYSLFSLFAHNSVKFNLGK